MSVTSEQATQMVPRAAPGPPPGSRGHRVVWKVWKSEIRHRRPRSGDAFESPMLLGSCGQGLVHVGCRPLLSPHL